MVRAAAKNHASVAVVTSTRRLRRGARGRRAAAASPSPQRARAGRRGVRAHRGVRRGRGLLDGQRAHRHLRRHRVPGVDRRDLGRAAVLRYGENPHQRAALYAHGRRGRAGAAPSSCTARRCPTTTTSTPTPPGGRPTTTTEPAVAIIKHANPCGIAVGADIARGAPQGARLRPGLGVRRRGRDQPAGHAPRWPSRWPRSSPRWSSRPASSAARWRCSPRKKNIRLLRLPTGRRPAAGRVPADQRRGADAGPRDRRRRRRRRRPVALDARGRGRGGRGHPRRPGVRLAGVPRGEVQRHPAGRRAARAWASAWARSTGSTPAGSRSRGPGTERARGAVAASDAFFPFADGLQVLLDAGVRAVVAARRFGPRRRGGRGRAQAGGVTMYFTGTRHFAH